MSPDRWRRIQALFDAVADLPRSHREAALTREASGDAALRREVEALLRAEGEANQFFERLGSAVADAAVPLAARAFSRGPHHASPQTNPAGAERQREGKLGAATLPPQGAAAPPFLPEAREGSEELPP